MFIITAVVGLVVSQCITIEEQASTIEKWKEDMDDHEANKWIVRVLTEEEGIATASEQGGVDGYAPTRPTWTKYVKMEHRLFPNPTAPMQPGEGLLTPEEIMWWANKFEPAVLAGDFSEVLPGALWIKRQQEARWAEVETSGDNFEAAQG